MRLEQGDIADNLIHQFTSFLIDFHDLLKLLHIGWTEFAFTAASSLEEFIDKVIFLFHCNFSLEKAKIGV
jgi:hypothetical protein